jgi:hypothetical protein
MCTWIAKFGKNMISTEEEESEGLKLMLTDGISAVGSAGSDTKGIRRMARPRLTPLEYIQGYIVVWQGRGCLRRIRMRM